LDAASTLIIMVSIHRQRKAHRAKHENPINVSVIVGGITKVIPWAEYEKDYLEEVEDAPEEGGN